MRKSVYSPILQNYTIGFLRQTRAGATALCAAAVAIMSATGVALISEHLWLVSKRDLLKSASSAASLAATLKLSELPTQSDEEVEAVLKPLAERYVRLNVLGNLGDTIRPEDITVTLDIERGAGTVGVTATAPLGGTILESFHGYAGPASITAGSGAEQVQGSVWAVLAIDVSDSMANELEGYIVPGSTSRRIDIVKAASRDFVDVLGPDPANKIAIGVVPWERNIGTVLPPSSDSHDVTQKINSLMPYGNATRSAAGLEEARTQLANAPADARKALVLLTDGEDNAISATERCSLYNSPRCLQPRRDQCSAAKSEGIEIFTVAAMLPAHISTTLGRELTACASTPGHAFLNNSDAEALRDAFSNIAGSLLPLRLTH